MLMNNDKYKIEVNPYRESLETLKLEIGKFVRLSENASKSTKGRIALKARKQSIHLRSLLKSFREVSIKHEKFLNNKKKENEEELKKELLIGDIFNV